MEFDVVIATRNRQAALQASLPLILQQDRLPRKLVVVDASDDHARVEAVVAEACRRRPPGVDVEVLFSDAGSAAQRNVGVGRCQSPVVLMPDDDSLWYPGYADAVLRVYERDTDGAVGAVCGTEATIAPVDALGSRDVGYRMSWKDRLRGSEDGFWNRLERRHFPDPVFTAAAEKCAGRTVPAWFGQQQVAASGPMTGFRMSFRTELIRKHPFDPTLGRYALFEDRDASLHILNDHVIARSLEARVFHYRSPEARVGGLEWGAAQILNRAYVVCKHTGTGSGARSQLRRFAWYKLARYIGQATSAYGRQRVVGAWRAIKRLDALCSAGSTELADVYLQQRAECLGGHRRPEV